mgnify:CR=1 FL=1
MAAETAAGSGVVCRVMGAAVTVEAQVVAQARVPLAGRLEAVDRLVSSRRRGSMPIRHNKSLT